MIIDPGSFNIHLKGRISCLILFMNILPGPVVEVTKSGISDDVRVGTMHASCSMCQTYFESGGFYERPRQVESHTCQQYLVNCEASIEYLWMSVTAASGFLQGHHDKVQKFLFCAFVRSAWEQ